MAGVRHSSYYGCHGHSHWHRSGYLQGTCIPLTVRTLAGHRHTPDTGRDTCRTPAYPWHWSGYLQGTCIPLKPVRILAGHLHTPDTSQDTCKASAYPWHQSGYLQGIGIPRSDTGQDAYRAPAYPWPWPRYLQGTCIPLTPVKILAGHLHTPDTGQDIQELKSIHTVW